MGLILILQSLSESLEIYLGYEKELISAKSVIETFVNIEVTSEFVNKSLVFKVMLTAVYKLSSDINIYFPSSKNDDYFHYIIFIHVEFKVLLLPVMRFTLNIHSYR